MKLKISFALFGVLLFLSSTGFSAKDIACDSASPTSGFVCLYKQQIANVLARTYNRDSGAGIPWVWFYNGGDVGVRCDFSEDNASLQCRVEHSSAESQKIFEKQGFVPAGKENVFVLKTVLEAGTDFEVIAERIANVLHEGLGLDAGHIVMMAPRAREESGYRVLPDKSPFHLPRTEAEKALDNIFVLGMTDEDFTPFMLGWPSRDAAKDTAYSGLFTPGVLRAWRDAEAQLVQEQCNGHYIAGEQCGLGFSPLYCGQDFPDTFIYQTLTATETEALMTYTYPELVARKEDLSAPNAPLYRMVKEEGRWKLDGVDCGLGARFSMPESLFKKEIKKK